MCHLQHKEPESEEYDMMDIEMEVEEPSESLPPPPPKVTLYINNRMVYTCCG